MTVGAIGSGPSRHTANVQKAATPPVPHVKARKKATHTPVPPSKDTLDASKPGFSIKA